MSIQENVLEKMAAIENEIAQIGDDTKPHPIADEVRNKAMRAILGTSAEWVIYMQLYAKNPEQLARLIPTDGTDGDEKMNIARAYLAANGMCAPGTGKHLADNVTGNFQI